jgi:imidazoleglycerol-phosphate dehydratase / histidinol-phosphatase
MPKKILFLDRDGTLIQEPTDKQVDSLAKFRLEQDVIPALLKLKTAGYSFVMVSNQDGLGTPSFRQNDFDLPQQLLLHILESQGIQFDAILICPHVAGDHCACRKPKLGLVLPYLRHEQIDCHHSYVIGDRETDGQLAVNMGINSILYPQKKWLTIAAELISMPRRARIERLTRETKIEVTVDLDQDKGIHIQTGIGFFDHMLEQLAKHGNFGLTLQVEGDLNVDEHHSVEDTALALGQALRKALGEKLGIKRYGFLLPMDEAATQVALDLSGRGFFVFTGEFKREYVGKLPTELIPHFFHSLADSLGAALHIHMSGKNTHHQIESIFKAVGRTLRQASQREGYDLPTTKGIL